MRKLSGRQREVATLVAEGLTNDEIALELGMSTHTVKNHLTHIYLKLGIDESKGVNQKSKRVKLATWAIDSGLVNLKEVHRKIALKGMLGWAIDKMNNRR